MKKLHIFFCLWALLPFSANADIIILKNGMRFNSKQVWEEKDEIKFYVKGFVVGFPKKDVLRIEKVDSQEDNFEITKNGLEQKKKELEKEYEALLQELEKLSQDKKEVKVDIEIRDYNEAVSKYNEKVAEYEKNREAYVTAAKTYNERIEKESIAGSIDKTSFEKMLTSWIGHPITDFIDKWGSPDDTFIAPNGQTVYLFVVEITPSDTRDIYFRTDPSGKIASYRSGP